MNLTNLRINQLSAEDWNWYQTYLAAIDARDLNAYAEFLTADCRMHFNNILMAPDKATLLKALKQYWQSYSGLAHEPLNIYGTSRAFMLEALNHYVRRDGKEVTLRAVALTDRNGEGLVTSVRIYSDTTPLLAP